MIPLVAEEDCHQKDRESRGEGRDMRQVWYADDATGVGKLAGLRNGGRGLQTEGRTTGILSTKKRPFLW